MFSYHIKIKFSSSPFNVAIPMTKLNIKLGITKPQLIYLSWFGSGFFPWAPGTFGTLVGLPFIYMLMMLNLPWWAHLIILTTFTLMAIALTESVQKTYDLHDPSWIVIDEVLGMYLTLIIAPDLTTFGLGISFLAFRLFDIIKIWPASFFDKKVHHGAGTILDDIISGAYAGAACVIFQKIKHLVFF